MTKKNTSDKETSNNMNVDNMKLWANDNKSLAQCVLMARVLAECEEERVNAYILPIFQSFEFTKKDTNQIITNPNQLYRCGDESLMAEYYAKCDEAHRLHGFTGPEGFCPAAIAKSEKTEAERAIIESLGAFAGVGSRMTMRWDESLELALGVCLGSGELS